MSTSRLLSASVALLLAGSLAACASDAPAASPSASPSASAIPTPSPTPTPFALTCETLLGPERWAAFGDSLAGQDYLEKIRNEGSSLALFDEYGGVLCALTVGDEIDAIYAASSIDANAQAAQEATLLSKGYVASTVDGGTLYSSSAELPPPPQYFFRDGSWWAARTAEDLTSIVANWPGA